MTLNKFGFFTMLILLMTIKSVSNAQVDESSELYITLKSKDSLLFDIGFNTCDINQFEDLVSEDFEFYHDQSGITRTKTSFIANTKDGLCKLNYKPRRELVKGSMEIYPLKNNGVLYGAIQMGSHRFYAKEEGKDEYFTSIAKFTHLWILENGKWQLLRVLSYDHQNIDK